MSDKVLIAGDSYSYGFTKYIKSDNIITLPFLLNIY